MALQVLPLLNMLRSGAPPHLTPPKMYPTGILTLIETVLLIEQNSDKLNNNSIQTDLGCDAGSHVLKMKKNKQADFRLASILK